MIISRRNILAAGSIGPMAAAAMAAKAIPVYGKKQSKRVPFDPANMRQSTMALLKLTGSQGNEIIRKWFTGKIYSFMSPKKTCSKAILADHINSTYTK